MKVELRDQFAMAAMQGLLAQDTETADTFPRYWDKGKLKTELLAEDAYLIADGMLAERKETSR